MASLNERARWEKWFDEVTGRMNRQKKSIDRLVIINTECMAALLEIAAMGPDAGLTGEAGEGTSVASERAQAAIVRVEDLATAEIGIVETINAEEPIDDPRRRTDDGSTDWTQPGQDTE